jgi:hypothetical protein
MFADDEPQEIGLCMYEPLRLSDATRVIRTFDRLRRFRPLDLPPEAFLRPDQLRCPPERSAAEIDEAIGKADLIVLGTMLRDDNAQTAHVDVQRTLKGRSSRHVPIQREGIEKLNVPADGIWFLGPRLPNGIRPVDKAQDRTSENAVRSRLERWQLLGRGCEETQD